MVVLQSLLRRAPHTTHVLFALRSIGLQRAASSGMLDIVDDAAFKGWLIDVLDPLCALMIAARSR